MSYVGQGVLSLSRSLSVSLINILRVPQEIPPSNGEKAEEHGAWHAVCRLCVADVGGWVPERGEGTTERSAPVARGGSQPLHGALHFLKSPFSSSPACQSHVCQSDPIRGFFYASFTADEGSGL